MRNWTKEEIELLKFGNPMGQKMCQADDCYQLTHFRWPNKNGIDYCSWNCYLRHINGKGNQLGKGS